MRNDLIRSLHIESLASDGRGIGFLPGHGRGKAVFVAGALPGQTIDCELVADKKNYATARLCGIVSGPALEPAPCRNASLCGGCPLLLMPYQEQLSWKRKLASSALEKIGGLDGDVLSKIIPSPALAAFRNKIELAVGLNAKGEVTCGFRKNASHEVFTPSGCILTTPEAMTIRASFEALVKKTGLPPHDGKNGFWRSLILRQTLEDGEEKWSAICLTSKSSPKNRAIVAKIGQNLLAEHPGLLSFIHEERHRADFLAIGEKRIVCLGRNSARAEIVHRPLGGKIFQLDPASFFQVNTMASEKLAGTVLEFDRETGEGPLLDLYCGAGAPGLLLRHEAILGIEGDAKAIESARLNASDLPDARFQCANLEGDLSNFDFSRFSTALIDPPRSGASAGLLKKLLDTPVQAIIHISCDPATFARDAAILKKGFSLQRLAGIDMFPHTPHLELCGLWLKNSGRSHD